MEVDHQLLGRILTKRPYKKTFRDLILEFEDKFDNFDPIENSFDLERYFQKGEVTAKKLLQGDLLIQEDWLRPYTTKKGKIKKDFPGLYIFLHGKIHLLIQSALRSR